MKFSGYGPGKKGGPKRLVYDLSGGRPSTSSSGRRAPSVHVQFRPYVSHQIDRKTARKLGFVRRPKGGVVIDSWAKQKAYMDHEKHAGRDVAWRDW